MHACPTEAPLAGLPATTFRPERPGLRPVTQTRRRAESVHIDGSGVASA